MNTELFGFEPKDLSNGCFLWEGRLPESLIADALTFESFWQLHPKEFQLIKMYGRLIKTPRWQKAFGVDYQYSGNINRALPIPVLLEPLHTWARNNIDARLNGLLLNWYEGTLGHYIGKHRDSTANMVPGSPIVTISFGAERIFRVRRWRVDKSAPIDFRTVNGSVLVMPWETNLGFTHEVPLSKERSGRRISVTLRAFQNTRSSS